MTDRNCAVTVFPYDVKISEIEEFSPDGILSNGPGDPEPCSELITLTKILLIKTSPFLEFALDTKFLL